MVHSCCCGVVWAVLLSATEIVWTADGSTAVCPRFPTFFTFNININNRHRKSFPVMTIWNGIVLSKIIALVESRKTKQKQQKKKILLIKMLLKKK